MPNVSIDKTYRTRDGRKVRVLCTDRQGSDQPVPALVTQSDGREATFGFSASGEYRMGGGHSLDLIEVVPDRVTYAAFYCGMPALSRCYLTEANCPQAQATDGLTAILKLVTSSSGPVGVEVLEP